jgi:hypothetical protein
MISKNYIIEFPHTTEEEAAQNFEKLENFLASRNCKTKKIIAEKLNPTVTVKAKNKTYHIPIDAEQNSYFYYLSFNNNQTAGQLQEQIPNAILYKACHFEKAGIRLSDLIQQKDTRFWPDKREIEFLKQTETELNNFKIKFSTLEKELQESQNTNFAQFREFAGDPQGEVILTKANQPRADDEEDFEEFREGIQMYKEKQADYEEQLKFVKDKQIELEGTIQLLKDENKQLEADWITKYKKLEACWEQKFANFKEQKSRELGELMEKNESLKEQNGIF